MSCTQTAAPCPAAVGPVLLHPRPSTRNSGVIVLVPLLADLHSGSRSPTLRVIADAEPLRKPPAPISPTSLTSPSPSPASPASSSSSSTLCAASSDRPSLIAGLPYKRKRANVNCQVSSSRGPPPPRIIETHCPTLPNTNTPCKRVTESPHPRLTPADATRAPTAGLSCDACPPRTPALPPETWFRVLAFVFAVPPVGVGAEERKARVGLLRVSKTFKNLASPLFYAYPHFSTSSTLIAFAHVLQASDRAWDSIRRIPYSTPGRWVQALDLSRISCSTAGERLAVDTLLTQLFPLMPFLSRLVLNSTVRMSRRAMVALAVRESAGLLRILKGVKWEGAGMAMWNVSEEDPLLELVRASVGLEELEVFGPGLQDEDEDEVVTSQLNTPPPTPLPDLYLPNLHSLMILSLPKSPLLSSLVRSPLPSLRHLMVTPYHGIPSALTSALIATHGAKLYTLAFHTPKVWPPIRAATPPTLLHTSPQLRALSLTFPLPALASPPPAPPAGGHPLRILSLPRPDATYLYKLEAWLYLGLLQCLEEVHMREVRWIRAGVSSRAMEAGVQGDMKEWKRRLGRWRVRVVDVSGKEDGL